MDGADNPGGLATQVLPPCIWCGATHYVPSREHVVPESLGCPPELILKTGVCKPCNNRLGLIDQALLAQFEVATVMLGVPRKRGRRPTIDNAPSIAGRATATGPEFFFNGGPGPMQALGRTLKPAKPSTGISMHSLSVNGAVAEMRFSQVFGQDRRFRRALYKLGLGLVAYYLGPQTAVGPEFDHIRRFVVDDQGDLSFMLAFGQDEEIRVDHQFSRPFTGPNGEGPSFGVRLFAVDMVLDLTIDQVMLRTIRGVADAQPQLGDWIAIPPAASIEGSDL